MTGFVQRYRRILLGLGRVAAVWAVALVVVALVLAGAYVAAAWIAAVLAVLLWWLGRIPPGDPQVAARGVLVGALAVATGEQAWWFVAAAVTMIAALFIEPGLRKETKVVLVPRHLPGYSARFWSLTAGPLFDAGFVSLTALALVAAGVLPAAWFAGIASAVTIAGGLAGLGDLRAWWTGKASGDVQAALTGYAPRFAIYYSGTPFGAYQIAMWLPYLERSGERYLIIAREQAFLETATTLTASPVVYVRSLEALERVMVPSLGAVFYVNNEAKNVNGIRFPAMRHVHLGHGDSDKPASYNAATAMFDLIFVAGQAGIDRYRSHGVEIPLEKFVKVGRPQVEDLAVRGDGQLPPERVSVLYAPTWRGGLADMGFGSLRIGAAIVTALLERGLRVVFRPHPYSVRDAESRVLIGRIDALLASDPAGGHLDSRASAELSVFECMNSSDAMVSDVSSLASDYLYTRKPFAITDMGVAEAPLEQEYPVARAAYILDHREEPGPVIDLMLCDDPLAPVRDEVRSHYLGDWPAAGYSEVFVEAVKAAIAGH